MLDTRRRGALGTGVQVQTPNYPLLLPLTRAARLLLSFLIPIEARYGSLGSVANSLIRRVGLSPTLTCLASQARLETEKLIHC